LRDDNFIAMTKSNPIPPDASPARCKQQVTKASAPGRTSDSPSPAGLTAADPAITLADYYMGRDRLYTDELTPELVSNAHQMVACANELLQRAGLRRAVNSGWRPAAVNATVRNAARQSKHMLCLAIDIEDDDGALDAWCMAHPEVLEVLGLWLEHPSATPSWCHVQIVQHGSWEPGKPRCFYP
jgi:hypothetical protein